MDMPFLVSCTEVLYICIYTATGLHRSFVTNVQVLYIIRTVR